MQMDFRLVDHAARFVEDVSVAVLVYFTVKTCHLLVSIGTGKT